MVDSSPSTADQVCPPANAAPMCNPHNFSQLSTLEGISWTSIYYGGLPGGITCMDHPITYPDGDKEVKVYQYTWCDQAECGGCLYYAHRIIRQSCGLPAGAQFTSDHCCVRFETYPFCSSS
ncbi:unnamed protein product [Linum trigynum]|uniref:Uncharacterized protein n=1 Tax=Linum trigynum TaxID=586398 RepID=A0AAV2F252_9ROSI